MGQAFGIFFDCIHFADFDLTGSGREKNPGYVASFSVEDIIQDIFLGLAFLERSNKKPAAVILDKILHRRETLGPLNFHIRRRSLVTPQFFCFFVPIGLSKDFRVTLLEHY